MCCTVLRREFRVNRLGKANAFVFHVKDSIVVLEKVDAEVGLARVAGWGDLQHAVPVAVDHVLVFGYYVGGLVDCKFQVGHCVELVFSALSSPETYWVESWLPCPVGFMHYGEQMLHGFLGQGNERSPSVW